MVRVRLTADVDQELRRRVKLAGVVSGSLVSEWVERAVRRELEREEEERKYYPLEGGIPGGSKNPPGRGADGPWRRP